MAKLIRLGKYELVKRIAVGGMSEIYLASQGGLHGFERAVIVKCIREDLDTDQEVQDMFLDEARMAACLKHPNIVHLYDVGQDKGVAYLAMEYIFGRDLLQISDRLRTLGRDLPLQFMLKVMCDALAGLNYAHHTAEFEDRPLNVVHRDISPQNIMVSFDGLTKVVDFGIAKAASRLSKTQAGVLKGKYAYMSPEQVRGKDVDHRSDQFSLATVAYESITGTRLFLREDDYATMEAVDAADVPPMRVLRKDVPRRLWWVMRRALRQNPNRRFKTCKDMERALDKLLKGSPVEQAEMVAKFMRDLFADELDARDQALEEAAAHEREMILSTGFEMIDPRVTALRTSAPPPPRADKRYQEILSERQGQKTLIRAKPLVKQGQAVSLDDATDKGQTQKTKVKRPWYQDWKLLLIVFLAVLVVVFFFLSQKGPAPQPQGAAGQQPGTGMEDMRTTARPGLDGFLAVSVRHTVRVLVDGQDQGTGAFRQHPLEVGLHKVELKDSTDGSKELFIVSIEANREFILSPENWQ